MHRHNSYTLVRCEGRGTVYCVIIQYGQLKTLQLQILLGTAHTSIYDDTNVQYYKQQVIMEGKFFE